MGEVNVRVVVLGATGNVGTSLVRSLAASPEVDDLVGIARRPPEGTAVDGVRWVGADITEPGLSSQLEGADAVVHLAWLIQPSRDLDQLWAVNVAGTENVLRSVAEARVRNLVYASSVGAYSEGPEDREVDETWPTHGIPTSTYSRQKAYVERLLDTFELEHPEVRVVRLRPALIFKAEAASEIRRFFLGAFAPSVGRVPLVPKLTGVRFQAVHSWDVAEAYRLATVGDAHGAFNIAAEPVLDLADVADLAGARTVPVPTRLLRPAAAATWRMRLHPVEPGWLDLAARSPIMATRRAREVLGWSPRRTAREAVGELLEGLSEDAGGPTPTLTSETSRAEELRTGQGASYSVDERTG